MIGALEKILHGLAIRSELTVKAGIEIFLIFLFVYACLKLLQGTRGLGILRGLTVFLVLLAIVTVLLTRWVRLDTVTWMLTGAPTVLMLLLILFQPEIRRALIQLGQNPLFRMFYKPHSQFTEELVKAVFNLARDRIGALIAIERQMGLSNYIQGGVRLDSEVTAELIRTIFWPGTPLHDGGIVIREQRIVAAGCLFPLTDNPQFSSELGTRHRAAIGLTEECDAVAIVVSEETGKVSLASKGIIQRGLDEVLLRRALEEIAAEPVAAQ